MTKQSKKKESNPESSVASVNDYDPSSPIQEVSQIESTPSKKGSKMTYSDMIAELFITQFHQDKKLKDQGVTYQLIWKELEAKYPQTNKQ